MRTYPNMTSNQMKSLVETALKGVSYDEILAVGENIAVKYTNRETIGVEDKTEEHVQPDTYIRICYDDDKDELVLGPWALDLDYNVYGSTMGAVWWGKTLEEALIEMRAYVEGGTHVDLTELVDLLKKVVPKKGE